MAIWTVAKSGMAEIDMPADFSRDREFQKLLLDDGEIDLVRLMLEFCRDQYDDLDAPALLAEVDRLGDLAARQLGKQPADSDLRSRLAEVSRVLYSQEGFHGNEEEYYDPRNSYLSDVLSRRCGIPISLGIVYMAVASQAGLPVFGVASPGHFVVGCECDGETLYVDPFKDGDVLGQDACRRRIERQLGPAASLEEDDFAPATVKDIAVRVLRNLKAAFAMASRWLEVRPVQERLALLLPELPDERRDLGLIYLRTGNLLQAIRLLEAHVKDCSEEERRQVEPYLKSARRLRAELN